MRIKVRFRRNSKEKFWETKEMSTISVACFIDDLLEKTTEKYFDVRIYKCKK